MAMDQNVLEEAEGRFDDSFDENAADFGDEIEDDTADTAVEEAEDAAAGQESEDAGESEGETEDSEALSDEDTEDSVEEDEEAPKKEPMLPKSRYDSVRRRLRAAEERLKALDEAAKDKPEAEEGEEAPDLDAQLQDLSKQFAQASLDADAEKMATLNSQMLALQNQRFQQMIEETRSGMVSESRDSLITDNLVDELVANNPSLDPDSKDFDQTLVARIEEFRSFYEERGLTESEALVKSVEVVMPQAFGESVDVSGGKAKQNSDSLKKKVEAASRQPPNSGKIGEDSPTHGRNRKVDISKMTLEDLDQLTDAEWDEALGNNL